MSPCHYIDYKIAQYGLVVIHLPNENTSILKKRIYWKKGFALGGDF